MTTVSSTGYELLRYLEQATVRANAGKRAQRAFAAELKEYTTHMASYPAVADPGQVGHYEKEALAGGGGRYDRVLEYRIWYRLNLVDVGSCCLTAQSAAELLRMMIGLEKMLNAKNGWPRVAEIHVVALVEQDWYLAPDAKGEHLVKGRAYRRVEGPRRTEWPLSGLLTVGASAVEQK